MARQLKTNDQQGMLINVVVSIVGTMLGGWFISPLVGVGTIHQSQLSLPGLVVSFVDAAIVLGHREPLQACTPR